MAKTVLEMNGIVKSFGPTLALNNICLDLREGEVLALLGENGAGKSTLIKVLGGIHKPDAGSIKIDGKKVVIDSVAKAREMGIGIIHQEIVLVPGLSIAENIFLGRELKTSLGFKDLKTMVQKANKMLADIGMDIDSRTLVGDLSIAYQQMVEIVKAISFQVSILVMDEPTSSLSDEETKVLFETIAMLKKKGVSIIYISHRLEELFAISQRITVIRDGEYVDTVETAKTTKDELVALMVGRSLSNYYTRTFNDPGEEVLRVEGLTVKGDFEDISFSVRRGEIVGFSGLIGAGRSEVMLTIFGARTDYDGEVYLKGKPVHFKNSQEAIDAGIAMVPEDRKKQGLTLINSVAFNINLSSLDGLKKGVLLSRSKQLAQANEYIERLLIKTQSPEIAVSSLSGGNQQKVVLGKWMATKPDLLVLDEPTRGVDVGAKAEIYSLMNEMAKAGLAIVLISSDLPEVINMSDRILVFREGHIMGELDHTEVDQEKIMKLATEETK